jgi:hypothetical protein
MLYFCLIKEGEEKERKKKKKKNHHGGTCWLCCRSQLFKIPLLNTKNNNNKSKPKADRRKKIIKIGKEAVVGSSEKLLWKTVL